MSSLRLDTPSLLETIRTCGAMAALILLGALFGGEAVWMYVRVNTLEQAMVTEHVGREKLVNDLNERILPNIRGQIEKMITKETK